MSAQRRPEPAERLLKRRPARTFELAEDGIIASLYVPDDDAAPGRALIVMGGSDGYYSLAKLIAERFCERGITALALAWWNQPGLPLELNRVPVEVVRDAARTLHGLGYEKVGVWGISKGAELALIAAASFPDDLSCVVAASPIDVVCQGLGKKGGAKGLLDQPIDHSGWMLAGRELPYAPMSFSVGRILRDSLRGRGLDMLSCYEGFDRAPEEVRIKVENNSGPVLLVCSAQDSMWPAAQAARAMQRRLDGHGFAHAHEILEYKVASHHLLPVELDTRAIFAVERRDPAGCAHAREDALEKTVDFLCRW